MSLTTEKDQRGVKTPLVLNSAPENIIPYKEKPAANKYTVSHPAAITAEGLFSLFTAEVIKKNTDFAR